MKRIFFHILFLLFVLSCTNKESENIQVKKKEKHKEVIVAEVATTEITFIPVSNFSDGFYGDSITPDFPPAKVLVYETEDSVLFSYRFKSWYPQSKEAKEIYFNDGIKKLVADYFKTFEISDKDLTGGIYNHAEIIAIHFNNIPFQYTGVLFGEQSYIHGAAHYNHGYISYHYDLKKGKQIYLTDILKFKEGEAQKFCDAFNPDPTSEIAEVVLEGEDFTKDRPFVMNYGELQLFFSDYEKGPSMTRVIIPYSKFKGYVNPEYKYLFEE